MASWQEIERVRKDPPKFRAIAVALLKSPLLRPGVDAFLESISRLKFEITTRQCETLLGIRDACELLTTFRGFDVARLLRHCFERRADLGEDDEKWIEELHRENPGALPRGVIGRLFSCARRVDLIEEEFAE